MRYLTGLAVLLLVATAAMAQADEDKALQPDSEGLYNVSLLQLGATAKGSGAPFNKDWPPNNALVSGMGRGGTLFGVPLKGGRVDIRLVLPVKIAAVEVVPLDYRGTLQPKSIDIFIEGQLVKSADLPETPGKPIRIAVTGEGQNVAILVTESYPQRDLGDGKKGPNYGGWARLRVLSPDNLGEKMKGVGGYTVQPQAVNIAPTTGTIAEGKVEVVGEPRKSEGHPCTIWDKEDVEHYKEMLKTSKELQLQYAGLKKAMDERMTQPLGIPEPQKGEDGKWLHLPNVGGIHNQLGCDIANLGAIYQLSGEAKYAEFCKKLLLAYADAWPNYGIGARPGFNHDPSKVFDQRLGDATWLIQVARGYDLIHDLPSITAEERKHIEDDLVKGSALHIMANRSMIGAPTNWSSIAMASVLMAGYATDDDYLIKCGLYGRKGQEAGSPENIYGGAFFHFGPKCIDEDGMWAEGAMGYQFMALEALMTYAEVAWHHGIDFYRYRDCALKRLFDSPLQYSYPDLTTPAIHDSGHGSIIGRESFLYELAYRRYRDPKYVLILNQSGMHLDAQFQKFPVSVLYDRDPKAKVEPVEWKSVNFFGVGYGILRNTTEKGTTSLLLDYGPNRSHGHPDKLNIDLFAFGDRLIPDPGSIWYEQPLYRNWYHTTLAHNTLCVDELEQRPCGADQLVYGSADSMGIQRARTSDAAPGVTMDRGVFLTSDYMADIFGAFARLPRKMDLCWHLRGDDVTTDLKTEEMKFPEPVERGYSELTNVRHAKTTDGWSISTKVDGQTARLVSAGGVETDVILGDGHLGLQHPVTIIQRRQINSTVWGNAVDLTGTGTFVKGVQVSGGVDDGYALMKVETARGTDLCLVSYRPGLYKAEGMATDAQQALALRSGSDVTAMYLGGGTDLGVGDARLMRNAPGLACVEKAETGAYIVGNPSPEAAEVSVKMPGLGGMDAYKLDARGERQGAAAVSSGEAGVVTVKLDAASRVEFAPKGVASVHDHRQAMLLKRQAEQEAAMRKAENEARERTKAREEAAAANPAPKGTMVVVQAEAFTNQGGGDIKQNDKKRAVIGSALFGWDAMGQWIEWTFDVPAAGYYHLTVCYCTELDKVERKLEVNGEVQEPFAPMLFPSTGGWANGSDDWRLLTAENPVADHPLLLKLNAGKNIIRLTNASGSGINVDWLAVTSPDVKVDRETLAAKLAQ